MPRKVVKLFSLLLCFCFFFQQTGFAQVAGELNIAGYIGSLRNSIIQDKFRPLHLRYISYNPQENNFRLLLDKGNLKNPKNSEIEDASKILLNYFLVGVTLPNDSFWVNLRPDSPDNIIDDELARTDVGKILLESDLQLKKDTAKFTSPETPEGREYWNKLYAKAGELLGSSNISIPTLTRPWIVPGEIIIRETDTSAYIYKASLEVMLEQDYLKNSAVYNFSDERLKTLNEYSSELIRELIIPKLTQEINTSKRYAPLRQVYYSLIMAQWFKARFRGKAGGYASLIDTYNLNGLNSLTPCLKETYFKEYQKSFKDGEYSIKEPIQTPFGQSIRSYFSGGVDLNIIPGNLPPTQRGLVNITSPSPSGEPITVFRGGEKTADEIAGKNGLKVDIDASGAATVTQSSAEKSAPAAGQAVVFKTRQDAWRWLREQAKPQDIIKMLSSLHHEDSWQGSFADFLDRYSVSDQAQTGRPLMVSYKEENGANKFFVLESEVPETAPALFGGQEEAIFYHAVSQETASEILGKGFYFIPGRVNFVGKPEISVGIAKSVISNPVIIAFRIPRSRVVQRPDIANPEQGWSAMRFSKEETGKSFDEDTRRKLINLRDSFPGLTGGPDAVRAARMLLETEEAGFLGHLSSDAIDLQETRRVNQQLGGSAVAWAGTNLPVVATAAGENNGGLSPTLREAMQREGYQVIEFAGEGENGVVYKVADREGITRALKIFARQDQSEINKQFQRETDFLNKLNPPGMPKPSSIPTILDSGELVDGPGEHFDYFVTEYFEGNNLKDMRRKHGASNALFDLFAWNEEHGYEGALLLVAAMRQIIDGNVYMTERGILHGNLPRNIILDIRDPATGKRSVHVALVDFGDARDSREYSEAPGEGKLNYKVGIGLRALVNDPNTTPGPYDKPVILETFSGSGIDDQFMEIIEGADKLLVKDLSLKLDTLEQKIKSIIDEKGVSAAAGTQSGENLHALSPFMFFSLTAVPALAVIGLCAWLIWRFALRDKIANFKIIADLTKMAEQVEKENSDFVSSIEMDLSNRPNIAWLVSYKVGKEKEDELIDQPVGPGYIERIGGKLQKMIEQRKQEFEGPSEAGEELPADISEAISKIKEENPEVSEVSFNGKSRWTISFITGAERSYINLTSERVPFEGIGALIQYESPKIAEARERQKKWDAEAEKIMNLEKLVYGHPSGKNVISITPVPDKKNAYTIHFHDDRSRKEREEGVERKIEVTADPEEVKAALEGKIPANEVAAIRAIEDWVKEDEAKKSEPVDGTAISGEAVRVEILDEQRAHQLADAINTKLGGTDLQSSSLDTVEVAGGKYKVERSASQDGEVRLLRLGPLVFVVLEKPEGAADLAEGLRALKNKLNGLELYRQNAANVFLVTPTYYHRENSISPYALSVIAAMLANAERFNGAVVFDAGAGDGLLARVALRLGAHRTVLIEKDPASLERARLLLAEDDWARDAQKAQRLVILPKDLADPSLKELLEGYQSGGKTSIALVNIGSHYDQPGKSPNKNALRLVTELPEVSLVINGGHFKAVDEELELERGDEDALAYQKARDQAKEIFWGDDPVHPKFTVTGDSGKWHEIVYITLIATRTTAAGSTDMSGKGGIDFRSLPVVTQPLNQGLLPATLSPNLSRGTVPIELDREWSEIENMLNGGIIPSIDRIKEYLAFSCTSEDCKARIDKALSCVAEILRTEEERCAPTELALKQLLVLLESDKPVKDFRAALVNIEVAPKEPVLVAP